MWNGFLPAKLAREVSDVDGPDLGDKAIPLGLVINEIVPIPPSMLFLTVRRNPGIGRTARRRLACGQRLGLPKDVDIDQPRASPDFKVIWSLKLDGRIAVAFNTPKGVTIQLDIIVGSLRYSNHT